MKWSFFLVVVSVISTCRAQNLTVWCPNMTRDLKQCETEFQGSMKDIVSSITDASSVLKFHVPNSLLMSAMCHVSAIPVIENFYDCIFGKFLTCVPQDWQKAFPDVNEAKKSLRYLCQNLDNIDITCLSSSSRHQALVGCVQRGAPVVQASSMSTADGYVAQICRLYSKTINCYKTTYGTCPKKTAEVLVQAAEFEKPMGCEARVIRPSLSLLCAFIMLCLDM